MAESIRAEAEQAMRDGIAAAEAEPPADPSLLFEHALADPPASFETTSPSCGGSSVAELTLVEAINDCFHVELGRDENVMVMGEDVGRAGGVFRATAGLRDKFGPTAAWTRRSRRPGSWAPRSGSAWPACGRCARCSTTRSAIRRSTS